jgi:hypothetical protein
MAALKAQIETRCCMSGRKKAYRNVERLNSLIPGAAQDNFHVNLHAIDVAEAVRNVPSSRLARTRQPKPESKQLIPKHEVLLSKLMHSCLPHNLTFATL